MNSRDLIYVVNSATFFLSHRVAIAQAARAAGYRVHVATGRGPDIDRVVALGFEHHQLPLSRSRTNPLVEIPALLAMYRLFRRVRPALVHLVTIKPVTYGGIAARLARVPNVVAAVSGLGFVFLNRGLKARLVRAAAVTLYRLAFGHPGLRVIVQNSADLDTLVRLMRLRPERAVLIRGSGVDLADFRATPEPSGTPVVLMAARLLRDKGIVEFVDAARRLAQRGVQARFQVAGDPDPGNPASVDQSEIARWRAEGLVELLGHRTDIAALMAQANIVVLPSYREGMPKVLLEAAASGRAVVTTDVPGCRDAIEPGVTGLLVPVKDSAALAEAIERLLTDAPLRGKMGAAGRELAIRAFSIEGVVAAHLDLYRTLLGPASIATSAF